MANFNYTPPDTLGEFFTSNKRVRFVRGPIGSTKSTAMVMELFRRACEQAPDEDGMRRTKFVIVRNTLSQIRETCLQTVYKCLRPIAHYKVSEQTVQIRMNEIESDWLFMPLDTPENINKLLSLELTGGWVSEAREIDPEIVHNVLSRCGRFPSELAGGSAPTWYGVIMESNSFSEDSPWFTQLHKELPKNWDYILQPGARDEAADWKQYLPPDYYDDLIESNSEDWVAQYVDNEIGPSLSGQAVFRKSFDHKYHLAEGRLEYNQNSPLVIGLDVGRSPAAIVGQMDHQGRLLCLRECIGENIGIELFLTNHIKPMLYEHFPAGHVVCVIDPAGRNLSQIGEESVLHAINRMGLNAILASTNAIDPRLRAVEQYLNRRDGMLIDRYGCPMLVQAAQHEYKYKRSKQGQLGDIPEKLHPWSDIADAWQYLCLGIDSRGLARLVSRQNRKETATDLPTGAWT